MNIDFHGHFLPGADHGSPGIETSLRQVALGKEAGMDVMVATPHFYPQHEDVAPFLVRRKETLEQLKKALPGDAPRILCGCETHLCRGLDHLEELPQLCVEGTNVLLLELPPISSIDPLIPTMEGLLYKRGLTVVLAHIDRYDPDMIDELLDSGFLAQLNVSSFCRLGTRKRCLRWAQEEAVVAMGSDIHGFDEGYRDFMKAKERLKDCYNVIMARTEALLKSTLL